MEFEGFKKKGFGKAKSMFGKPKKKEDAYTAESFVVDPEDPRSDKEKEWARTLEDDDLARDAYNLYEDMPNASLPELILYLELARRNMMFEYQVEIYGGRGTRGGLIPDFLVKQGGEGYAIEVQGEYWHGGAEKEEKDRADTFRMLGANVSGVKIKHVATVWENDLYPDKQYKEFVVTNALAGISMRGQ
jgi:hypothetical protein